MTPSTVHRDIVGPGLAYLPARFDSRDARVMLLAIGYQESGFATRVQRPLRAGMPPGPARGYWQFERGGGVRGVLEHSASRELAAGACETFGVPAQARPAWSALAVHDGLAVVFARLLLWTDAAPLPVTGDEAGVWAYYLRNWRPGKPHPERWPRCYRLALEGVGA